jgi:DNA-directed RNA polymerase subunit RPC12/RpoP
VAKPDPQLGSDIPEACPHCGQKLSPWQRVLLGVDRALMCRSCWYRIILDVFDDKSDAAASGNDQPKPKK